MAEDLSMTPLWFWELESGKDYWLTMRDWSWMLYCANRQYSFVRHYPELFDTSNKIGTALRIKLPTPEFMFPDE
jgi:hypothetical protein